MTFTLLPRRAALAALLAVGFAGAVAEPAATTDPMVHLRQRLQEKLGAIKAPDAEAPNELQVASRQPTPTARPAARAKPAVTTLPSAHGPGAGHAPWGYSGEGGPAQWGAMHPKFSMCAKGQRQSPIDIRDGLAVDLAPIRFDYRASGFSVIDNGHTVQVDVASGNSIDVVGRRYELQQFHFHRPSEERINGRQFDLSVHLVHRDPDGRLAVVAVVLERGAAQSVVQQIWNNLPLEKNDRVQAPTALDPSELLPTDRRYFTYMGSLTTPPCSEGVMWIVMQQPVQVSTAQIAIFERLYPMNARPVQASAGRIIKQSH